MPIYISQYGGYEGSYAGDCCLMSVGDWHCLVDLGRGGGCTQTQEALTTLLTRTRGRAHSQLCVVLTHLHADHIADPKTRNSVKAGHLYHFASTSDARDEVLATFGNKTQIDSFDGADSVLEGQSDGLSYRLIFAPPEPEDGGDQNALSMGVLFEVIRTPATVGARSVAGGGLPFSFLSLGDMTPRAADDSVRDMLATYGFLDLATKSQRTEKTVDLIKLAHHGSENNLLPVLRDIIVPGHTRLIISGYTMTATDKLRRLLRDCEPAACVVLFESTSSKEKFESYAALPMLLEAGATLGKDCHVTLSTDGVAISISGW